MYFSALRRYVNRHWHTIALMTRITASQTETYVARQTPLCSLTTGVFPRRDVRTRIAFLPTSPHGRGAYSQSMIVWSPSCSGGLSAQVQRQQPASDPVSPWWRQRSQNPTTSHACHLRRLRFRLRLHRPTCQKRSRADFARLSRPLPVRIQRHPSHGGQNPMPALRGAVRDRWIPVCFENDAGPLDSTGERTTCRAKSNARRPSRPSHSLLPTLRSSSHVCRQGGTDRRCCSSTLRQSRWHLYRETRSMPRFHGLDSFSQLGTCRQS